MVFATKLIKGLTPPDIFAEGTTVDRVSDIKYLGVILSEDCTDDLDIA